MSEELLEKVFSESMLKSIAETIVSLPDRVRDEENGRYCYPEEYQHKVFRLGTNFLLFNSTAYEEVSFDKLRFLVNFLNKTGLLSNNQVVQDDTETNNKFNIINNKFEDVFQKIEKLFKILDELSEQKTTNIDINEFADLRDKLSSIITEYDEVNNDIKLQMEAFNKQVENLHNSVNKETLVHDIGTIIWEKMQESNNQSTSSNENTFNDYNEFKAAVEDKINKLLETVALLTTQKPKSELNLPAPQSNNITQTPIIPTSINDNDIDILCKLRQAGYTANEIISLKINKLI